MASPGEVGGRGGWVAPLCRSHLRNKALPPAGLPSASYPDSFSTESPGFPLAGFWQPSRHQPLLGQSCASPFSLHTGVVRCSIQLWAPWVSRPLCPSGPTCVEPEDSHHPCLAGSSFQAELSLALILPLSWSKAFLPHHTAVAMSWWRWEDQDTYDGWKGLWNPTFCTPNCHPNGRWWNEEDKANGKNTTFPITFHME